jgi:phospholipid/cholesterol/gamma-HCH transport system ATP-binding protein
LIRISIDNVWKSFGAQQVLNGVSVTIEPGELLAVVGPSGTGKSVLLKTITGLMPVDRGSIMVGNESITDAKSAAERRRLCSKMGVLFQAAALFDSLNLLENVAFPLRMRKELKERQLLTKAMEYLDQVGLAHHATRLPGEVSIGMRKRVGIARALITEPSLILFDEPNTGLDPQVGQDIYDLIRQTHQQYGFTGVVISHEIPEVFQICSRVVMLYSGVVQIDGSVDEFLASTNPVVQQFIAGDVDGPIKMAV